MSQVIPIARLTPMRSCILGSIILVLPCVLACGRAAPTQSPPGPAPEASEPGTSATEADDEQPAAAPASPAAGAGALRSEDELSRAEQALAEADAELESLAGQRPEQEQLETAAKPKKESATPHGDACTTTCKALASLERARDAICRIDGPTGERCERANTIVDKHAGRRQSCGCAD